MGNHMKITKLGAGSDGHSFFETIKLDIEAERELGLYSKSIPVKSFQMREFAAGLFYDWHNAPHAQYIVYLSGQVQVRVGSGDERIFSPGDILLAADLDGSGHTTETLTDGCSLVIAAEDK